MKFNCINKQKKTNYLNILNNIILINNITIYFDLNFIANYIFSTNKIFLFFNFKKFLNKNLKFFLKTSVKSKYFEFFYILTKKPNFLKLKNKFYYSKILIKNSTIDLYKNNFYIFENLDNSKLPSSIKISYAKANISNFFGKFIFFTIKKTIKKKNKFKKFYAKSNLIESKNVNKYSKTFIVKKLFTIKNNINNIPFKDFNFNFKYLNSYSVNFLNYTFFIKNFYFNTKSSFFLKKPIKKNSFKNYLIFILDFYSINFYKKNMNIFSNKYLINYMNNFNEDILSIYNPNWVKSNLSRFNDYNNYYPIVLFDPVIYNFFFKKFTQSYNANFVQFNNKLLINFFELAFKKNFFIKITNNNFNKLTNYYYYKLVFEYRNYQPLYLKKFLILDFIEIVWYSFLLRDLNMLSEWITKLMESLNFKNHKKFLSFFQNFLNKFSGLFLDALSVKGFFFDIRGKVGVTGSSKKRHFCYKFGSLKKSSKNYKICFNQNLVRTYSGVMGLTYILCY